MFSHGLALMMLCTFCHSLALWLISLFYGHTKTASDIYQTKLSNKELESSKVLRILPWPSYVGLNRKNFGPSFRFPIEL